MSGRPKFSLFRPWVEPSPLKRTKGDRLGLLHPTDGDASEERTANIKLAYFFAAIALEFVLADYFSRVKDQTDAAVGPDSAALVSLTLSPRERPKDGVGSSVPFRLSNRGNHSIFNPMRADTNVPFGQIVARTSPSSECISLSTASEPAFSALTEFRDKNFTWIEMPPGGWVDGEFSDPGDQTREHAYAIFLKPSRNAGIARILSEPYGSGRK